MILADKIIELRKKNGWSQEELAEKMDVSRQSISKWEGAQSVPDMNRILRLSEIFGVSTDLLLKDDLSLEDKDETQIVPAAYDDIETKAFSMEEASAFLAHKSKAAVHIAIGVMMCILSPILIIVIEGLKEGGFLLISEDKAEGIGLIVMFIMIGIAVALFVVTGLKGQPFEYLETELIDTSYGVDGMVRERKEHFRNTFIYQLTIGIVLCVMSVVPIFTALILFGDNDTPMTIATAILLMLVAIGVLLIVRVSIIWGAYQMILEEGDYTRDAKIEKKKNRHIEAIYWMSITAIYLAYSFVTQNWDKSWIIWPVAGVSYGIVTTLARLIRKKG